MLIPDGHAEDVETVRQSRVRFCDVIAEVVDCLFDGKQTCWAKFGKFMGKGGRATKRLCATQLEGASFRTFDTIAFTAQRLLAEHKVDALAELRRIERLDRELCDAIRQCDEHGDVLLDFYRVPRRGTPTHHMAAYNRAPKRGKPPQRRTYRPAL